MVILEDHSEEIFDPLHSCRVGFSLFLSRSIILIAKVNVSDALVELDYLLEGAFCVDLPQFVHIEVKHLLNFNLMLLILEFEHLLPKREFFLF